MHLHTQNTDTDVVQIRLLKNVPCICNCIFTNDCLLTIKSALAKESVEVGWVQVKESFPQLWLTSLVSHKHGECLLALFCRAVVGLVFQRVLCLDKPYMNADRLSSAAASSRILLKISVFL